MPASRLTQIIIGTLLAFLLLGFVWIAHGLYAAWHKFATEDRISGTFHPVITALYKFETDTGQVATNLDQLIPRYLPKLPTSAVANSVEYRVLPDGTNWQLSVHSRALKLPRVYLFRTSPFTTNEQGAALTRFHGWTVFEDKTSLE